MSMPVLVPGPLKKRQKLQKEGDGQCILCKVQCKEVKSFNDIRWEKFKNAAEKWKGLDRYGGVYDTIDWGNQVVQEQLTFHRNCLSYLQTKKKLTQAKEEKEENINELEIPIATSSIIDEPQQPPLPPPKASNANPMTPDHLSQKLKSTSIGKIYDKDLHIWCMEPDDHLKKKKGPKKLFHMEQKKTWRHFCACTPYLKD